MHLNNKLGPSEPRDESTKRCHVEMATEDQVSTVRERGAQCRYDIATPIAPRRVLSDASRRCNRIGRKPWKHCDRRHRPSAGERAEEIAVVLGNSSAPAERIGHERKHG